MYAFILSGVSLCLYGLKTSSYEQFFCSLLEGLEAETQSRVKLSLILGVPEETIPVVNLLPKLGAACCLFTCTQIKMKHNDLVFYFEK